MNGEPGTSTPADNVVETIRARRFELVDESGKVRAVLGQLEEPTKAMFDFTGGAGVLGLQMLDDDGEERMTLAISNNGDAAMLSFFTRGKIGRLGPKENMAWIRTAQDASEIELGTMDPQDDFPVGNVSLFRTHRAANDAGQNGQAGEEATLRMASDSGTLLGDVHIHITKPAPVNSEPSIRLEDASGNTIFEAPPV